MPPQSIPDGGNSVFPMSIDMFIGIAKLLLNVYEQIPHWCARMVESEADQPSLHRASSDLRFTLCLCRCSLREKLC